MLPNSVTQISGLYQNFIILIFTNRISFTHNIPHNAFQICAQIHALSAFNLVNVFFRSCSVKLTCLASSNWTIIQYYAHHFHILFNTFYFFAQTSSYPPTLATLQLRVTVRYRVCAQDEITYAVNEIKHAQVTVASLGTRLQFIHRDSELRV